MFIEIEIKVAKNIDKHHVNGSMHFEHEWKFTSKQRHYRTKDYSKACRYLEKDRLPGLLFRHSYEGGNRRSREKRKQINVEQKNIEN